MRKVSKAERGHEQNNVGLIDERPQHQPFDPECQDEHHDHGQREREERGHAVFMQTHKRERGEHHHDPLGKIEHARGFEDQHEAKSDQCVEHAGNKPIPQRLHQEIGRRAHLHERINKNLVQNIHGPTPPRTLRDRCAVGLTRGRGSFAAPVRLAEIGTDHVLVALHLIGCAVSDLAAVVEHHNPIR